jgi:hypothetical protein
VEKFEGYDHARAFSYMAADDPDVEYRIVAPLDISHYQRHSHKDLLVIILLRKRQESTIKARE